LVGTRLNSNWSIEGHYTNFATDTVAVNGSPTAINMSGKSLGVAGTPKTNGMVERVNGTIKNTTVKATTYQNIDGMKRDLNQFIAANLLAFSDKPVSKL
jgi:hypothetical protein